MPWGSGSFLASSVGQAPATHPPPPMSREGPFGEETACATYELVEHFRGEVMDVVRQDDRAVEQVSQRHLAVDRPAGTDGQGGHALTQEQV